MIDPLAAPPVDDTAPLALPTEPPSRSRRDTPPAPLVTALEVLRRYRALVITLPFLAVLATFAAYRWQGPVFTSRSRFTPEGGSSENVRLSGLATQFGFSLPRSGAGESVDFYQELMRSNDLLREVAASTYAVRPAAPGRDSVRGDLVRLFHVEGRNDGERLRAAVDELRQHTNVVIDVKANLLTLAVSAPYPELAAQINRRMLDLVSDFNLKKRQSRAGAERAFTEARLRDAQRDLNQAEDRYQRFLEANRVYQTSPQLTVEAGRLQRLVQLRQQVYTSLAQAYEQARLDEIRNTPVITVIDAPESWTARSDRPLRGMALALIPALVLAVALAFALDYLARQRRGESGPEASPGEWRRTAAPERAASRPPQRAQREEPGLVAGRERHD